MNALFQLQEEIDLQNMKFPIKWWFVWSPHGLIFDQNFSLPQCLDEYKFSINCFSVKTTFNKISGFFFFLSFLHRWHGHGCLGVINMTAIVKIYISKISNHIITSAKRSP